MNHHTEFKSFVGNVENGNLNKKMISEMRAFTKGEKVDAKSIGISFVEHRNEAIVVIGHNTKKSKVHADFKFKKIGNLSEGMPSIEKKISKAADKAQNLICQAFYTDSSENVHLILMVGKTA